jgi:hypothetical protein
MAMLILTGSCPSDTATPGRPLGESVGQCAWVFLIAGGFLFHLAHVVALLLMENVKYRGSPILV